MKKIILFLFVSQILFGQENNLFLEKRTFNSYNGYKVSEPNAAFFDKLGFLWISGLDEQNLNFSIDNNDVIIQRFDGVSFFDVKLPKFEQKPVSGTLIDGVKKLYYLVNFKNSLPKLYEINEETLQFTLIDQFSKTVKKYEFKGSFSLKNNVFFVFSDNKKVVLQKVEGHKFVETATINKFTIGFMPDKKFISNREDYTIFSTWGYNFLINYKGEILKEIKSIDFINTDPKLASSSIYYYFFSTKNNIYFTNEHHNNIFELHKNTKEFRFINIENVLKGKLVHWLFQSDDYVMTLIKNASDYELSAYRFNEIEKTFNQKGKIHIKDADIVASRDVNNEVIILYGNTIEQYFFNKKKIKTVLKEKSIRSVKKIDNTNYVIATDTEGFYKFNLQTGETNNLNIINAKKTNLLIQAPRDIIYYNNKYIINNSSSLFFLDSNFNYLNDYKHDSEYEEMIFYNDTIFKAGFYRKGILKFSLKDKKYHLNNITDDFFIREFAVNNNQLYGLTKSKGLLHYNHKNITFYQPESESPDNLLSLTNDEFYGLLVSTKDGKLYHFDTKTKRFSLWYQDEFKASIVGVVSDSTNVMWLNTFAGIVSFNPKLNVIKRFSKDDGIYELEGNRYSTYKDAEGNIFMGSFKGLHYFNPYELSKSKILPKLIFTSLSYYDTKQKLWTVHNEPKILKNTNTIQLPAYYQRFNAKIGLSGILDNRIYNYRYRLLRDSDSYPQDWNKLYLENEIIFTNLSAGNYTLEVEILDATNIKIGETLTLSVVSFPFFFETWWFLTLITLIIGFIIYYFFNSYKVKQKLHIANELALNEAKIKEVMMLEIHHRIKNNLQVVSGLLSIQAFNSDDEILKSKLRDSQSRIESIAGIHNILYSSEKQETAVFVKDYFLKIIDFNKTLFPKQVKYNLEIEGEKLSMDKAIPLALILNELINNSYKHAFTETETSEIFISFKKVNKEFHFQYHDNGVFKKRDENKKSMGLKIISMMSSQLKGTYQIHKEQKFMFKIKFLDE